MFLLKNMSDVKPGFRERMNFIKGSRETFGLGFPNVEQHPKCMDLAILLGFYKITTVKQWHFEKPAKILRRILIPLAG